MKTSRHWTILIALFPIIGTAQLTTYDSRHGVAPVVSQYPAIDIGTTNDWRNPDYQPWMRGFSAPALVDVDARIGVAITGTVAQAEADLNRSLTNQLPAIARERGKDIREESRAIRNRIASERSAAGGQGTVLLLRARVIALMEQAERQAELVEQLQERVEMLEREYRK
jgi:hypothetical protein